MIINSKCMKCGGCCSTILPLTDKEIKHLKRLVKKRKLKPHTLNIERGGTLACPFLNEKNLCDIYDERPAICKSFTCHKFVTHDFRGFNPLRKYSVVDVRRTIFDERR